VKQAQFASLARSRKRDAAYYSQLPNNDAMEFSGYNAEEDQDESYLQLFGPLLNSTPSHPDTV